MRHAFGTIAGLVGVTVLALGTYRYFRGTLAFEDKISLAAVLQVAVVAYIGGVLQDQLQRRSGDVRAQKDLLAAQAAEAIDIAKTLRESFLGGRSARAEKEEVPTPELLFAEIVRGTSILSTTVSTLEELLQASHVRVTAKPPLRDDMLAYKRALTGAAFPPKDATRAHVAVEQTFSRLHRSLKKVTLAIHMA